MSASLPHDIDAERALLCCAMLDESALGAAGLPEDVFYAPRHRAAWGAAHRLAERAEPIDPITIADEATGLSPDVRAELRGELTGILAEHHIASAVTHHAASVRKCWVTRKTMMIAASILERVEQGQSGVALVSEALADLSSIEGEQIDTSQTVDEMARRRAKDLHAQSTGELQRGFPTGVLVLDDLLGGLQPGVVTIAAGRPGMGKSAFAMGVSQACTEGGMGAHVFSLEDTRDAYSDRILARYSGIAAEKLRTGHAFKVKGDWGRLKDGINRLHSLELPWLVDDRSGIDAAEIVRSVRRHAKKNRTMVVIVDYVQLLKRPARTTMHEHMGESVTILADAAKRDGMAYLVLSQLNRGLESRDDKRPRMSDLRESGSLEERAKAVIALYRHHVYDDSAPERAIELHVLKNNQGRIGFVEANWDGPTTTIK